MLSSPSKPIVKVYAPGSPASCYPIAVCLKCRKVVDPVREHRYDNDVLRFYVHEHPLHFIRLGKRVTADVEIRVMLPALFSAVRLLAKTGTPREKIEEYVRDWLEGKLPGASIEL
ncbi:MAG: hypothetical protein QW512_00880 [Thermofilaceae archaeon]